MVANWNRNGCFVNQTLELTIGKFPLQCCKLGNTIKFAALQQDLNTDKRIPGLKTLHCLKSTLEAQQSSIIQDEKILIEDWTGMAQRKDTKPMTS